MRVAEDGRLERLDGGGVDEAVHARLGLGALVALQRAQDLVLDGRDPFLAFVDRTGLKVPHLRRKQKK